MKIFQNEYLKLIKTPLILFLTLSILMLNTVLIYSSDPDTGISPAVYKKAYTYFSDESKNTSNEISTLYKQLKSTLFQTNVSNDDESTPDSYDDLLFSDDIWTEYQLISELNEQISTINNYPQYVEQIIQSHNDQSISIFSQSNPYEQKSSQKTIQVFQNLSDVRPSFVNSRSFSEAINSPSTDFLILLILFIEIYYLVIYEREQGLFSLQLTMYHGRAHFMLSKVFVLLCNSIFINFLFWGCNLIITQHKYGAIQFSAPIQSVNGFDSCGLFLSIQEYWILFTFMKAILFFSIAVGLLYIASRIDQLPLLGLISTVYFVFSYGLYYFVDGNSPISFLKYCNLIPALSVNKLLSYYFNVNILGYPISAQWMFAVFCVIFDILFIALLITHSKPTYLLISHSKKKHQRTVPHSKKIWNIFTYEAYKNLILQKGALLLVAFFIFQTFIMINQKPTLSYQEKTYKTYMEQLNGPVTEEKRNWIKEKDEHLNSYFTMLAESKEKYNNHTITEQEWYAVQQLVSDQTRDQEAFSLVKQRLEYLDGLDKDSAKFIYEGGYEYLSANTYSGNKTDQLHAIILLTMSVLLFSPIFSMEYTSKMITLLSTLKNGRKQLILAKIKLAFVLSLLLYSIVYLSDFLCTVYTYGLPSLSSACINIPSLATFGSMPLYQYYVTVYIVRFVVYVCIVMLFLLLSTFMKNAAKAIFVGLLIFIFPIFSALLGITQLNACTFNIFISGNQYMYVNPYTIIIPITIGIISVITLLYSTFNTAMCRIFHN